MTPTNDYGALKDLEQRLSDKALALSDLADETADQDERRRLRAKAEGVDLALSFVQEYLRD